MNAKELTGEFGGDTIIEELRSNDIKLSRGYLFCKRTCDILLSFLGIVLLSPLLLCIAVLVKATSRGPVIYKQERVGRGGRTFTIYKFRTMVDGAENGKPVWAQKDDDRTTVIGKSLRKYRLDELPQLINILSGDMSVVGPRPEREYFYQKFEKDIPNFRDRLAVKPGLTGLAQVNGGYDITPKEKFLIDKKYIADLSVKNDLHIMFKTIGVVFKGEGAR